VSISIIAILTAIAVVSFSAAQKKARDSRRISDMGSIQKAAEQFYSANDYLYPENGNEIVSSGFIQQWPTDPKGGDYPDYVYTPSGTFDSYCACAKVESLASGNSDNACVLATSGEYYCVKNQQ